MRLLIACTLAAASAAGAGHAAPVPTHLMPKSGPGAWRKFDSGLEIYDVKEGKGEPVKPGATVVVHYTGWLGDENGKPFDSSRDRNEKMTFALGSAIKGWQEGVPGMRPGGVRRLKVPAALGYGERGVGGLIPPNAVMVFEIELFEAK